MLFICYPKCTTCQKAARWLEEQGVAAEVRDIKQDNPTEQELRTWHKMSGLPLKRFFNTSGLQYKALGLKDKLPQMTEDEQKASEKLVQDLVDRYIKEVDAAVEKKNKEIMEL